MLSFEELVKIEEKLMSYQDLQELRAAKLEERAAATLSLDEVKAGLGL